MLIFFSCANLLDFHTFFCTILRYFCTILLCFEHFCKFLQIFAKFYICLLIFALLCVFLQRFLVLIFQAQKLCQCYFSRFFQLWMDHTSVAFHHCFPKNQQISDFDLFDQGSRNFQCGWWHWFPYETVDADCVIFIKLFSQQKMWTLIVLSSLMYGTVLNVSKVYVITYAKLHHVLPKTLKLFMITRR